MANPILVPELREIVRSGDFSSIEEFCQSAHPAHIAEFLAPLESREIWQILSHLEPRLAAEIFSSFEEDVQSDIIAELGRHELARLISHMSPDERVDLLKRLPQERRDALWPSLAQAEREDIRRLASYPEGTVGAIMTSDYAMLSPELTAAEALAKLRREAPDKETIYYTYVVDPQRRLIGFVSLKDLILARSDTKVEDLMRRELISIQATDDQEEAARTIERYDLLAVPVVDKEGKLVGIVTYDDAMDVVSQENTEDIEKLMAIGGEHQAGVYLSTPVWVHFRNRVGWIVVLAALGLVSGAVVHSFEGLLLKFAILATFMPMLADTGGNTGSQSATVVIRALALREISPRDATRVLFKELRIASLIGAVLFVLTLGRVLISTGANDLPAGFSELDIGVAVAVALTFQVVSATLIGAILPLLASAARFDPAVVASPALTTIVDITGLLIYFGTVKVMLHL